MSVFNFAIKVDSILTIKQENPISIVIPHSWLYGFLSSAAVDRILESTQHNDVLPESIWPIIPTFMLRIYDGVISKLSI